MTYTEFKKTYSWMVKNYPDTYAFCGDMNAPVGNCTIENYHKQGSRWILDETRTETGISNAYYCNTVDAIPFFRNLGGREIVTECYTKHGYIPVEINSIRPNRQQKTVRKFTFD